MHISLLLPMLKCQLLGVDIELEDVAELHRDLTLSAKECADEGDAMLHILKRECSTLVDRGVAQDGVKVKSDQDLCVHLKIRKVCKRFARMRDHCLCFVVFSDVLEEV
jgi:hypothetical protein